MIPESLKIRKRLFVSMAKHQTEINFANEIVDSIML